jgi:hypothetical protein
MGGRAFHALECIGDSIDIGLKGLRETAMLGAELSFKFGKEDVAFGSLKFGGQWQLNSKVASLSQGLMLSKHIQDAVHIGLVDHLAGFIFLINTQELGLSIGDCLNTG